MSNPTCTIVVSATGERCGEPAVSRAGGGSLMAETLRTDLQGQVMGAIVVISRDKIRAGQPANVTTAELSARIGRYGQPLGHSCGSMADRGLLQRRGPATYRLTRAGLDALQEWMTRKLQEGTIRMTGHREAS